MSYLLTCLQRKDKDRQLALITIGYLAVCVEGDIAKYLPKIVEFLRATLPQNKVKKYISKLKVTNFESKLQFLTGSFSQEAF